jgi:hypothetical protein
LFELWEDNGNENRERAGRVEAGDLVCHERDVEFHHWVRADEGEDVRELEGCAVELVLLPLNERRGSEE